jgi:hypothetical protein
MAPKVDVVTFSHFGIPDFGSVSRVADRPDALAIAIHDFPLSGLIQNTLPVIAWKWLASVPNRRFQEIYASDNIVSKVQNGHGAQ